MEKETLERKKGEEKKTRFRKRKKKKSTDKKGCVEVIPIPFFAPIHMSLSSGDPRSFSCVWSLYVCLYCIALRVLGV